MWDEIPMLLSTSTHTLFTGIGTGVLSIDDALQLQVQAQPPAIAAVFGQAAATFDTRTKRNIGDGAKTTTCRACSACATTPTASTPQAWISRRPNG